MKLVRLLAMAFSLSLRRQLAYRANLVFELLVAVVGVVAGLAALAIVYTQTSRLGGWTEGEAIVLLGTFQVVSGVRATFIEPNVLWFAEQVKSGKLDDVLLKPVPSVFLATLGSCAPLALLQILVGLIVVGSGLNDVHARLSFAGVIAWLVLVGVAVVVTWSSRALLACLAFWVPSLSLDVAYDALWQFGRYPVAMYQQPIRFVLSDVLPVALISTVPAYALTHGTSPSILLSAALIACGSVGLVRMVWSRGLRRYTGATS